MTSIINMDCTYALSAEQLASYEQDGFLLLHDFVPPKDLGAVQAWTREVQCWPHEKGKWMHYEEVKKDGGRTLCRTENFVNYHQNFEALLRGKRTRQLLAQLSGEEMLLFKEKINYKNRMYVRLDEKSRMLTNQGFFFSTQRVQVASTPILTHRHTSMLARSST